MSKEELVSQLLEVFRQQGYAGTSLAQISQVTGLGKASLYHYFPKGKEEMAEATLDYMEAWVEANILKPLTNDTAPKQRLQEMLDNVGVVYEQGHKSCLLAVLTLEQSSDGLRQGGGDRFATRIKQALLKWIDALANLLRETGLNETQAKYRAEEAILQIQGALILSKGLGDNAPFVRTIQRLAEELI